MSPMHGFQLPTGWGAQDVVRPCGISHYTDTRGRRVTLDGARKRCIV